jgi:hypothetical protein
MPAAGTSSALTTITARRGGAAVPPRPPFRVHSLFAQTAARERRTAPAAAIALIHGRPRVALSRWRRSARPLRVRGGSSESSPGCPPLLPSPRWAWEARPRTTPPKFRLLLTGARTPCGLRGCFCPDAAVRAVPASLLLSCLQDPSAWLALGASSSAVERSRASVLVIRAKAGASSGTAGCACRYETGSWLECGRAAGWGAAALPHCRVARVRTGTARCRPRRERCRMPKALRTPGDASVLARREPSSLSLPLLLLESPDTPDVLHRPAARPAVVGLVAVAADRGGGWAELDQ